jgi:hypothetical protein
MAEEAHGFVRDESVQSEFDCIQIDVRKSER